MSAHHLIWVHIEGGGGGCGLPVADRPSPLDAVPYPALRLTNMVCGWISTIGSVSGLVSGVSPAYLLKNHVSKGQAADASRFSLPHDPLPVLLESRGYRVEGFSVFFSFREQIPFFRERHAAVGPDTHCFVPDAFAAAHGCEPLGTYHDGRRLYRHGDVAECTNITAPDYTIVERVRDFLAGRDADRPTALFIHLGERATIPSLFEVLGEAGFTRDNSVMLVMGDHGFPDSRFGQAQRAAPGKLAHDKGMTEGDLRVAAFLGYPGCADGAFGRPCISWDMAPTVAELLGHDPAAVLPGATGMSLVPYFADDADYPARTLRIDNRYVEQEDLKVVGLMDARYRYVFRFRTHWCGGPLYNYYTDPQPCPEELYRRDDLAEAENLVFSPRHLPVLHAFRQKFRETEEAIIAHHFGSRVFAYPALERARFHIPEPFRNTDHGMVPASPERVLRGLAAALRLDMEALGVRRPLLVGPARDTGDLLAAGVLAAADFAGVTEAGPDAAGLPAFDAVVIGSLERELELFGRWHAAVGSGTPILSPFRRLERDFDPSWPLAIPDGDLLDYFRSRAGVIYGAGGRARQFLAKGGHAAMGMTLRAVLDSSPALHGATESGLPVYTYSKLDEAEIEALDFDYFLIASFAHFAILKDIIHWTLRGKRIYYLADNLLIQPDGLPREGTWLPLQRV